MRLCSSLCIERQRVGTRLTYGLTMKTPNGVNVELDYGQEKCLRLVLGGTGTSWQRTTKIPLDCAYEKKACVIDCQRNEPCHTEMPRVWQIQDHPLRRLESFYLHSPQCNSADYGERRSWRSCSSLDKWGRRENVVFVKVHSSLFVIFTSNCVPEKVDKDYRMQLGVQCPITPKRPNWKFCRAGSCWIHFDFIQLERTPHRVDSILSTVMYGTVHRFSSSLWWINPTMQKSHLRILYSQMASSTKLMAKNKRTEEVAVGIFCKWRR